MTRMIRIFDTTLRDGEQSPGCSMNLAEKLEMARALRDLGVDIIEAGFPVASKQEFDPTMKFNERVKKEALKRGLSGYPMGGTIDGKRGDHFILAPPYIVTAPQIDDIVARYILEPLLDNLTLTHPVKVICSFSFGICISIDLY